MASATGSHPDTGSSVRPLPGSSTTLRPATGRRFSAPKITLLTERGFATGRQALGTEPLAPPWVRQLTHPGSTAVRGYRWMGIGLTDLNRTGRMRLWRTETADELGEPITQDSGVRIATTQHHSKMQVRERVGRFVVLATCRLSRQCHRRNRWRLKRPSQMFGKGQQRDTRHRSCDSRWHCCRCRKSLHHPIQSARYTRCPTAAPRVSSDFTHKVFKAGDVTVATYGHALISKRNVAGRTVHWARPRRVGRPNRRRQF